VVLGFTRSYIGNDQVALALETKVREER
jgi:hypothetical protein